MLYAPQLYAIVIVIAILIVAAVVYRNRNQGAEGLAIAPSSTLAVSKVVSTPLGRKFVGASAHLVNVLRVTPRCADDSFPTLISGTVTAYPDATSQTACGSTTIQGVTPLTFSSLDKLERDASATCGQRAGWYVVNAATACDPLDATASSVFLPDADTSVSPYGFVKVAGGGREGFCWGGETSRENFRSSGAGMSGDVDGSDHAGGAGPSDCDFCAAGRTDLESRRGFAPDCVGACTNISPQQQKRGVAADYEYESLRMLNGEV